MQAMTLIVGLFLRFLNPFQLDKPRRSLGLSEEFNTWFISSDPQGKKVTAQCMSDDLMSGNWTLLKPQRLVTAEVRLLDNENPQVPPETKKKS